MLHLSSRGSAIIQGAITLLLVALFVYLIAVGQPVPDVLREIVIGVLAFWFGARGVDTSGVSNDDGERVE